MHKISPLRVRQLQVFAAFLLTAALALYFRTYPLRSGGLVSKAGLERKASAAVQSGMLKQLESHIVRQAPQISPEIRKKLARQKLDELLQGDDGAYQKAVSGAAQNLGATARSLFTYRYLSEADPYYYFDLSQNILKTGRLGPPAAAGGFFWNPKRTAPFGHRDVVNLHPYTGVGVYRFLTLLKPGISLMHAVGFTPLFLTVIAVAAYFVLAPLLPVGVFALWISAQIFFLAPIGIQRSTLGWYDTDPYNLIFPILIFATLLAALRQPARSVRWALAGAFLTGVYPLFWQGWAFIFALICGVAFVLGAFEWLRSGFRCQDTGRYFVVYAAASLVFAVLFLKPMGVWETLANVLFYSTRIQGASGDLWPNLLVLVGETANVTFKKWVYLTSHYGVVLLAAGGLLFPALTLFKRPAPADHRPWAAVALMALPLILFTFTAERFAILAVLPLALLGAFAVQSILDFSAGISSRIKLPPAILKLLCVLLLAAAILPRSLLGAHVSGYQSHFIMNDEWFGVLNDIKAKTPPETIVYSWWPPGYFIQSIADRRSLLDGGTHEVHENFWMAKALMARDPKQALGLFRMLAASGNTPMEALAEKGIRGDRAMQFLMAVTRETRAKAETFLPAGWSAAEKSAFLDLTHGKGVLPPAVVLTYEDLIAKNLMLQVVDQWSFDRAQVVFDAAQKKAGAFSFLPKGAADYSRKMLQVTGPGLPYEPPAAPAARREGKIIFPNGLVIDGKTFSGMLTGPKFPVPQPVDVFYKKDGVWAESSPDAPTAVAAILLDEEGSTQAVLCHRALVHSLIFQLSYFGGANFPAFKLLSVRGRYSSGRYVNAYQIDWSALEN